MATERSGVVQTFPPEEKFAEACCDDVVSGGKVGATVAGGVVFGGENHCNQDGNVLVSTNPKYSAAENMIIHVHEKQQNKKHMRNIIIVLPLPLLLLFAMYNIYYIFY
jgi:hypothetical protein